jgi:hypothetical protein
MTGNFNATLLSETNCSGRSTGNGRTNAVLTRLKIAVFAPMPSASVMTAINVKPGFFNNIRAP